MDLGSQQSQTLFSSPLVGKAKLATELQELSLQIKAKRDKQKERLVWAMSSIQKHALFLLKRDLPTEEAFENANNIEVDFAKNTFAVDGKNQFSASSVAFLKNCIHYGVLFASLELDFLRYPRFILCDNMEDKGMQAPRSQNFQRCVVELAKTFQVEHQVIFTTSMIDASLNNTALCIGPEYSKTNKSLRNPLKVINQFDGKELDRRDAGEGHAVSER